MSDRVLIVFQKEDVAQLVEGHQRQADDAGIAGLRCIPGFFESDDFVCRFQAIETPAPQPRTYDIRSPEFTRDMAETIETYWDSFQSEGELRIESNARGLWFRTPWGQHAFIGLARSHENLAAGQDPHHDNHPVHEETQPCEPVRPR